ncbi:HAMP domain-containing sensor histidine kinase [Flaviaesturariibacter amylovorans]|uniref:histidine kinase n=1 Tax=Flaviaesturariibacter amylovorans TaxID=1084520 RepID=A0ABP8H3Q9_9BACT
MKTSARVATFFIFLFFLFFNAVGIYLIVERFADTKAKFNIACTSALLSTLTQYHKLKGMDSASKPRHAFVVYSAKEIRVARRDTQHLDISAPLSPIHARRVEPSALEPILDRSSFQSLDLAFFDRLYRRALDSGNVRSEHRLDTLSVAAARNGASQSRDPWGGKRRKEYDYATRPVRIFFSPNSLLFAEFKYDRAFYWDDLLWPMLAFVFILAISNGALLFVYKTIRRQKRINEVKTDFINNITHEMKTPITIASAGLDALGHHIAPTERTSFYLQTSKRQLHLLNEFVERILESAVQDLAGFTLKKEPIDLHRLFGDLVQSHTVLQAKPTHFRLTGEGPIVIPGDRLHLETAFHNIIDNAVKYSHDAVDIEIDLAEKDRDCVIRIRDNGMGIPPQFLKNIFEKFFRVPQGDAHAVKGFGLGLYYVSSIIKKHSGTITVHSKPQSGTEFTITLPRNA